MSGNTPTVDEIEEKVKTKVSEFDSEGWQEKIEKNKSKFGKFGDEDFVAWATAYVDYGVKIEADFALPGGGGNGGSGVSGDIESYKLNNLESVDHANDEQIELSGYVLDMWETTSSNDNIQVKFRLRDETDEVTVMATGDKNVENVNSANIESGDYIRLRGANVFHPEDSDYYGVTLPYWAEIDFPEPDFNLENTAKDFVNDIVNPGDFVHVSGIVTDSSFNDYEGCVECMKKYDPDEYRVCPNCGADKLITYRPGRIKITDGGTTSTVSFAPSDELNIEDPLFSEVEAFGVYTENEYDGTTYKEIDVVFCRLMGEDESIEVSEEIVEVEDEDEDEEEAEETDEVTVSSNGDTPEEVKDIQEKVLDFGHEMPAMAGIRVLAKSYGIEDEDEQVKMMVHLRDLETVSVKEDEDEGHTIEEKAWQDVMLEAAE